MKNYLNLVLAGYYESSQFFSDYLIREQKKAERDDFIEDVEFFKKCDEIVSVFKLELDKSLNERKKDLERAISIEKETGNSENLKNIMQELQALSLDNFTVHLHSISKGDFSGHLWNEQVIYIENCITNAGRYIHYLKCKRCEFIIMNDYKLTEYDTLYENLISYKFSFSFIKKKLSQEESIEFANKFLDFLSRLEQKQSLSKHKLLINVISNGVVKNVKTELLEQSPISLSASENKKNKSSEKKKIGYKYYALLYWMELNANGKTPPRNYEGEFVRSEIQDIGIGKGCGKGQEFYRAFIRIPDYLNSHKVLKSNFGEDWKETITTLSENDEKIIKYIEKQYPE